MLPTAQYASPRARMLLARQAIKAIPSVSVQARSSQQSRNLCGFNLRRRQRLAAYKHITLVNRQLSWGNSKLGNRKNSIRKTVDELLQSSKTHPSGKYTNVEEVQSWSDDLSSVRPGRSIEDVEREAINHLLRTDTNIWTSLQSIRESLHMSRSSEPVTAENVLRATAGDELNFIDPITNRRVPQDERGRYSAANFDNPNAPRKLTPEEASKQYTDLNDYKPAKWNEPDGLPGLSPEEKSKEYTDLPQYTKITIDNPDQPRKLTPEEESKNYDDLDKYNPVTWNEPDGLPQATPEEKSKDYDDLHKYGPVKWHEPDGLQEKSPEEKTKDYKDLHQYGAAVTWNEPDGLRIETPEEKSKHYEDLHLYSHGFVAKDSVLKAYEAIQNDPTPKAEPFPSSNSFTREPTATEYEDLDNYGPIRWNEPDGLRPLTAEEKSKEYEDLHRYDQYPNTGPRTARVHPEEASKTYEDLSQYAAFPNNGPSMERIHPEEASKHYKDLPEYAVDGYFEPEKTKRVHPEELTKNYADLSKYEPQSFDSPGKPYPIHPEESSKSYKDLFSYQRAPPDAETVEDLPDAVVSGLESYDAKISRQAEVAATHRAGIPSTDALTADEIRAQVMGRAGIHEAAVPATDEAEISSMDESFPSEIFKPDSESIERITNKLAKLRAEYDPYTSDPKGLETSYSEECGKDTQPALVRHYETATTPAEECAEGSATYKILAYDPSTQSVNIAETTSSEHVASPAKLADVLLQLAHPSKFLPYFQSLQAHGYDIVSGGGDVLIFRQTRPAAPDAGEFPPSSIAAARVNPVDMMGRPISGNFASPTGYVNYDTMEDGQHRANPPFLSNSYAQSQQSGRVGYTASGKKKRSLGKKVAMGTMYVGGAAIAVGAMGEFLSK